MTARRDADVPPAPADERADGDARHRRRRTSRRAASCARGCARRTRTRRSSSISRVTGVPSHLVRVTGADVGGGFGQKFFTPREELTVALAARRLGRTLKWIEDRRENLIAVEPRRASTSATCTFALDADGRFARHRTSTTSRTRARIPIGATGGAGALVGMLFTGPYQVPLASFRTRVGVDEHVRARRVPRAVDVRDRRARADDRRGRARDRDRSARVAAPQRACRPSSCRTRCRRACRSST